MNTGSHEAMPVVCGRPSASPQPCWNTRVRTPKAAATESRLSRIALIGITIERKVIDQATPKIPTD